MAIAEPANELYAAVKSIWDPWPPDNEDAARELGAAWRQASGAAGQAASQLGAAGQGVAGAWLDQAGNALSDAVNEGAQRVRGFGRQMQTTAQTAEAYAQRLIAVKQAIIQTVAANLKTYLQLGGAALGAVGGALQRQFAAKVANELQRLVLGAATEVNAALAPTDSNPKSLLAGLTTGAGIGSELLPKADGLLGAAGKGAVKGLGPLGAIWGYKYDRQHGESAFQAGASNGAGLAAGTLATAGVDAGATWLAAAGTGALAGSWAGPVGAAVGGVVGLGVGAFTSGAVDSMFKDGFGVQNLSDGWDNVVNTGKDIGGFVSDKWNAMF